MNHPRLHDAVVISAMLLLVGFSSLAVSLTILIPETPTQACAYAEDFVEYPTSSLNLYGEEIDLGFDREDFERSMRAHTLRNPSILIPDPIEFVTPDHPVIQRIAEVILNHTEGQSDYLILDRALQFVQSTIVYAHDCDLYHQDDFWAYPIECLYLGRGDCEDTSILFASIVLAMGYDCVFLSYPDHYAVGVALEESKGNYYELDGKKYYFCETTARWELGRGGYGYYHEVEMIQIQSNPQWRDGLGTTFSFIRDGVYRLLRI